MRPHAARDLAKDAFRISVGDEIPFYDSLFLAASEREKAPLMTMDRRLCQRVKGKQDVRMI
jgi:predicted nucleic acid-binding protein